MNRINRRAVALACATAMVLAPTGLALAQAGPATTATVTNSPATVDDIPCPPPLAPPPEMIEALRSGNARRLTMPPEVAEMFRKRNELDPGGLCRYRDENKALARDVADRVVFIGDSITEGWKASAPELFVGNVVDRGISGQTTSQMLLRFREDVIKLRPRVVHIMGGINDINPPAGTALTISNITSMIELAQANGIRVVLASITPSTRSPVAPDLNSGPRIVALNRQLRALAAAKEVAYVDYYSQLVDGALDIRREFSNDGLHPNQRGYDVMNPVAKAAIRRGLAGRARRGS